jgi:hypothetical protein
VTVPFPVDLPDLLRLACGQGKMRLYTSYSAERGHQSALARTGDGWDSDADPDCLVSMTKVLRQRFGNMLERERANLVSTASESKLQHRMSEDAVDEFEHRDCDCERESEVSGDDIRSAIAFHFHRIGLDFSDAFISGFAEGVLDALYGKDEQPNLYEVEMTTAGAHEPQPDNDFEALL